MKKLDQKDIFLVVGTALGITYACRYITSAKKVDLTIEPPQGKSSDVIEFKSNLKLYDYPIAPNNNEENQVTTKELLVENDLKMLVYHKTLYSLGLASDSHLPQMVAMNGTIISNANVLSLETNKNLIAQCLGKTKINAATKNFIASMLDAIIQRVRQYQGNDKLTDIDIQRMCASVMWVLVQKIASIDSAGDMFTIGTWMLTDSNMITPSNQPITKYHFLVEKFFEGYFNCEVPMMTAIYVLGGSKNDIVLRPKSIPNDAEGKVIKTPNMIEPMFFNGIIYYNDVVQ